MNSEFEGAKKLIKLIVTHYDFANEDELIDLWKTKYSVNASYEKMSKADLQALCKEQNLKVTGTKAILIERLTQGKNESIKKQPSKKKPLPALLQKLQRAQTEICISRNAFNHYEHADTHFIFDELTKKVIGKQNEDGTIKPLTIEDYDICKQNQFDFDLPGSFEVSEIEEED
jgi:hypothetical protein